MWFDTNRSIFDADLWDYLPVRHTAIFVSQLVRVSLCFLEDGADYERPCRRDDGVDCGSNSRRVFLWDVGLADRRLGWLRRSTCDSAKALAGPRIVPAENITC
jgi:hypothetical protein